MLNVTREIKLRYWSTHSVFFYFKYKGRTEQGACFVNLNGTILDVIQ